MPRGATPLGSTIPSLEASNQSQIDDLVQRSRTLEHAKQKLAEQLAHETARSKEVIADLQKQWKAEKVEWSQACDVLHSCHRVVQLRNLVALEMERANMLKEQDITRKEKLLRLQRDFRITTFQAREAELEDRMERLEAGRQAMTIELNQHTRHSKGQHAEYIAQLRGKDNQISILQEEKKKLEIMLENSQEDVARLSAIKEETSKRLERANLQAESASTTRDELKRNNDDLKRANAEMHSQLEKWQNLENEGDIEIELHRKKHDKLQTQIRDLQSELEEAKEEHKRLLGKEKKRVERLKESVEEWQAASGQHEDASEDAQRQLARAMKQISKLKEALDAKRTKKPVSLPSGDETADGEKIAPHSESPVPRPRPRPRQMNSGTPPISVDSAELDDAEATTRDRTTKVAVRPSKHHGSLAEGDRGSDAEEELHTRPRPKSKNKGKAKATIEREESDTEAQPKPSRHKRKVEEVEIDDEGTTGPASQKPKKARRTGDEAHNNNGKVRRKAPNRARSASVQARSKSPVYPAKEKEKNKTEAEEEPAAKKKRRKINIFPTGIQTSTFDFTSNVGDAGLNIPLALSPVKDSENVLARSNSGSVIETIGSMLRNSFKR